MAFCDDPEHKRLHRPEQFCFPFMVEKREGVGRFVLKLDYILGSGFECNSLSGLEIDLISSIVST